MPIEEMGLTYLAEADADGNDARTLLPLQAAGCQSGAIAKTRAGAPGDMSGAPTPVPPKILWA